MWLNYLKVALRNLARNRLHTSINLLGLALGIACCLLISIYVQHEVTFDDFHQKRDRIFRVSSEMTLAGNADHYALSSMAVGPGLQEAYPEVEAFVRYRFSPEPTTIRQGEQLFKERYIHMVDPSVFEVFDYPLVAGSPQSALAHAGTVVLTESLAKRCFADRDPLGQRLDLNGTSYEVSGVMADLPPNTDLPVQALVSTENLTEQQRQHLMTDWGRMAFYTFLLFQQPEDAVGFKAKMDHFTDEQVIPFWEENSIEGEIRYHLTALPSLHFRNDLSYDTPKGNRTYLSLFSVVAAFILLLACINYVNLAVAQSARRGLEVGIRKVAGANGTQLIRQFIGESLVMALLALGLGIVLVELALPVFNGVAATSFTFLSLVQPALLLTMLGIVLFVGVIAGSYPALVLAHFQPAAVLKGQGRLSRRHWLSQALVVVQFAVSIGLLSATWVVYAQMDFLKNQDLGFDKDQVMVVEVPRDTTLIRAMPQFLTEVERIPGVSKVATTGRFVPGEGTGSLLFRIEQEGQLRENHFPVVSVDERFAELMDIPVLAGRNFERSRGTDPQQAFIVNETFVRENDWGTAEDALGKRMQWGLMANNQAAYDGTVVGVIEDYHFASLHNTVDPLVWLYNPSVPGRLLVKLEGEQVRSGLEQVQAAWRAFDPNHPASFFFLDSFFDLQYAGEERMMKIFGYFSLLTILIACMGLFGLASYITQRRLREIGIRKTLGAEVPHLVYLISRDFALLVLIALVIATVFSVWGMYGWLENFAFPVAMPWYVFPLTGFFALGIALLTTSYHAYRAAYANPTEVLRQE